MMRHLWNYNGIELQFLNRTATHKTYAIARRQCKLICIRVYFYSNSPSASACIHKHTLVNAVNNYCVFCVSFTRFVGTHLVLNQQSAFLLY